MARQNHGPLTRAKGKLGGVVYQQYEGMQIAREYQPNVKNPQSEKQTTNRAKFKLSSQIVAEFYYVFRQRLGKLSIYDRTKRGASVNAIFNGVMTVDPTTPDILVDSVISAINGKSMQDFEAPEITVSENTASIVAPSGDIVFATCVGYDSNGNFNAKTDETYTSSGTAKQIAAVSTEANVVMAVSLRATTEAGRAIIENLGIGGSTAAEASFSNAIVRGISQGDFEVSALAGTYFAGA